ncbi:MAG: enoyl-CoA hydratase-related protein, partial [Candidatus Competibacteraceae bacterium]
MPLSLLEIQDDIATITMNHPEKHNALSDALIQDLLTALEECRQQKVRVIILRAPKGAKVWSAGHDVTELPKGRRDPLGWSDPLRMVIRAIEEFPAPIIAMIEGGVWGGGCEVVLACDLLVAATGATFAITPAKLGVPYNMTGVLNVMNVMSRAIVNELFYTAQPISAERAERLGA